MRRSNPQREWTRWFGSDEGAIFGTCKQKKRLTRQRVRGRRPASTGRRDAQPHAPGNRRRTGSPGPPNGGVGACKTTLGRNRELNLSIPARQRRGVHAGRSTSSKWPNRTSDPEIREEETLAAHSVRAGGRNLTPGQHPSHTVPQLSGTVLSGQT